MTDLVLDAGRLLPGLPGDRRARPAARRAASRSTPAAPTSSATSPRATRRGCRCSTSARSCGSASPRRSPTGATRGATARSSCCAGSGSTPSFDVATDPFFGRSGRMLAASQREQALKFEILVPDRRARADGGRLVQLPPGPLRRRPTGSSWPTAAWPTPPASASALERITLALLRTHGLDLDAWPDEVRERAVAAMSAATTAWSACSASTRRPTGRTRCTRRRAHLHRDQLLHATSSSSCSTPAATSRWRRWASRVRMDFEGDQWTFFKPPPEDLERLFGIDIHEMQPYRPLPRADRRAARATAGR